MRAALLGLLAMAGLTAFLAIRPEQPWILALTALVAGAAAEAAVRSHPRWEGGIAAALSYALLPALAAAGAGLFIDAAIEGYARVVSGLAAGAATGLILYGEYRAVVRLLVQEWWQSQSATKSLLCWWLFYAAAAWNFDFKCRPLTYSRHQ